MIATTAVDVPRCDEVLNQLSPFLDGELDRDDAARVVIHLARCAACARFAAELVATIEALHGLPGPDVGPSCPIQ